MGDEVHLTGPGRGTGSPSPTGEGGYDQGGEGLVGWLYGEGGGGRFGAGSRSAARPRPPPPQGGYGGPPTAETGAPDRRQTSSQ